MFRLVLVPYDSTVLLWIQVDLVNPFGCGLEWISLDWFGLVWVGLDWFGLVWIGLGWCGLVNQFWNWKWFLRYILVNPWMASTTWIGGRFYFFLKRILTNWAHCHWTRLGLRWFLRHRMQRNMCNIMMQNDAIIFTCSCVIGCNNIIVDWRPAVSPRIKSFCFFFM